MYHREISGNLLLGNPGTVVDLKVSKGNEPGKIFFSNHLTQPLFFIVKDKERTDLWLRYQCVKQEKLTIQATYTTDQLVVSLTIHKTVLQTLLIFLVREVLTRAKQSILPVVGEVLVLNAPAQHFCNVTRKRQGVVHSSTVEPTGACAGFCKPQ
jgi:hypothetical protein